MCRVDVPKTLTLAQLRQQVCRCKVRHGPSADFEAESIGMRFADLQGELPAEYVCVSDTSAGKQVHLRFGCSLETACDSCTCQYCTTQTPMPEYYEEVCSMDQYHENPFITLRVVDLNQSPPGRQMRIARKKGNPSTMRPNFPTLIPAAKTSTLREDQLGRLRKHNAMYSTARPNAGPRTRRRHTSGKSAKAGQRVKTPSAFQGQQRAPRSTAAPHTAYTDGGMFTPEARIHAHMHATQPLQANQQRRSQLEQQHWDQKATVQVPSVQSTAALDEYTHWGGQPSAIGRRNGAHHGPVDEAKAFHASRIKHESVQAQHNKLAVSGASGGFEGFQAGEFNPRTSRARPSTAPISRRPRSAARPASAAMRRPLSSGGGTSAPPPSGLGGTEPSNAEEMQMQQELDGHVSAGYSAAGRVDEALRGRGEFAGAVHREPAERTGPNANAFELRIKDIQNRIEERLARYADASRRPATVHVESLSSIRAGGRSMAEKYGRQGGFDALRLQPSDGHGSDSDDTAELLEDRPSPIKRPVRRQTREGLPPRPNTSSSVLPAINSSRQGGTVSMPTTPIVHDRHSTRSLGGSPESTSPLQPDFALSLGSELHDGQSSSHSDSRFTVSAVPQRRGNALPARPHTSAGSRTPVWGGTLAPPTRPARTPTSATAFPGRVMHQRSLRIMGQTQSTSSPQRRVQRPDPNAFRVAMLTLSADMKSGDMTLSLFDPSTAKIHKQTYGAEQLAQILPVPASFHSSSHVLKYKWWEQRLHTMADSVTVDVDDEAKTITMHLHAPTSPSSAVPSSPSSIM